MKRTIDEHAARFDRKADAYDESTSPEYLECRDTVVAWADPRPDEVVLDLGTGTGAIALALAPAAGRVVGRDISEGMLEEARRKAEAAGIGRVEFDIGRFLEPNYDGPADVVTSNYALHHLDDAGKRRAIVELIDRYSPARFVLGDVMLFDDADPEEPLYDPAVDDPAAVATLVDAFESAGLEVVRRKRVHPQAGVLLASPA